MGGWLGSGAAMDAVEWRKMSFRAGNKTPAVQTIARHYTDCAIAVPVIGLMSLKYIFLFNHYCVSV
jgi:hypothetical protein